MTTIHIPHYRKVAHVTSINTGSASPLISLNFQSTLDTPHCLRGYESWCLMTKSRLSSSTKCQTRSTTAHAIMITSTTLAPQTVRSPLSGSTLINSMNVPLVIPLSAIRWLIEIRRRGKNVFA